MSFAVFGISMDFCLKVALKRVKPFKKVGDKLEPLDEQEWLSECRKYAERLYARCEKSLRLQKLSADLTQPSAAYDFIRLARATSTCSHLQVYQRQPVAGKINPATKLPIMKFQPWEGAA